MGSSGKGLNTAGGQGKPKLRLQNLTKRFGQEIAVENLSLTIQEGELLALVGHSGCGKTTLLRLISGLTPPDAGSIWLDGQDVTALPAGQRDIVMVFQENLLFPHLTVGENIAFGLKMTGCPQKVRIQKTRQLLELIQLPGIENKYPSQLSGGQKQRVSLARALALEPKTVLLDEPLSNLDPKLREELRDLILRLHKELQMTTVLVTHDRDEAMLMADRIAVMSYGKLLQVDTPINIYNQPRTREVASLFGPCNFLPGYLLDGEFWTENFRFTVPALKKGGRMVACIRSEHIKVTRPSQDKPTGVITEKKFLAGQSIFKVAFGNFTLLANGQDYFAYAPGNEVGLEIDWSRVYFNPEQLESGRA
ncbi:MAG TPA: ABC transporter ATP-binding protein [Peptococcaceae bacterium]|nr:ABC transporter ATP-binding protein [Peptococcaceae bacterium]